MYLVEKMVYSILTSFIGRTFTTSIPTTVVETDIHRKIVGTVYFDKSCLMHAPRCSDASPEMLCCGSLYVLIQVPGCFDCRFLDGLMLVLEYSDAGSQLV